MTNAKSGCQHLLLVLLLHHYYFIRGEVETGTETSQTLLDDMIWYLLVRSRGQTSQQHVCHQPSYYLVFSTFLMYKCMSLCANIFKKYMYNINVLYFSITSKTLSQGREDTKPLTVWFSVADSHFNSISTKCCDFHSTSVYSLI